MEISFQSKRLSELNACDILRLRQLCLPNGVFKTIIKNLINKTIEDPNEIFITIAVSKEQKFVGWLLEDSSKEYNEDMNDDECSIHIYVHPSIRHCGVARGLMENRWTMLRKHARIVAYVHDYDSERYFFERVRNQLNLNLDIECPIFYPEKEKQK